MTEAMKSFLTGCLAICLLKLSLAIEVDINQYLDSGPAKRENVNFEEEDGKKKLSNAEIYANLKESLASIRKSCGQLCDVSMTSGTQGKYFDQLTKEVDCKALFENENIDNVGQFKEPPMRIPKWLYSDYDYNGRVPIEHFYRDDSKGSTHYTNWTKEIIDIIDGQIKNGTLKGE